MGIGGSAEAMPLGAKWIKPVKVVLVIGAPIPAPVGADGKRPSRRQVHETTETLRTRIQALYDDAQARGRPGLSQPSGVGPRAPNTRRTRSSKCSSGSVS